MFMSKLIYQFTFMPACPVHIKPDGVPFKSFIQVTKNIKESLTISPVGFNHSVASQQRRYPPRDIQALTMLAGGRDTQTLPRLGPAAAQPGVQAESSFVLKYNPLFRLKRLKFFLKSSRIAAHLWTLPEYKSNWRVLNDSLIDASIAGHDALLALYQNAFLNEQPVLGRPTGHDLNQTLEAKPPNVFPNHVEHLHLNVQAVQAGAGELSSLNRLRLHRESSGSDSSLSALILHLSILGVDLLGATVMLRSLSRLRRQGFSWLTQKACLSRLLDALNIMWDFSYTHNNIKNPWV